MSDSEEEIAEREATSPMEAVVKEAQFRFDRCVRWEANARNLFLEDIKFANADSDNGYQWPNDIRRNRDIDERPVLTVNKTRQHNLQIINDAKRNKPSIKIQPTGNGATYESAQIYEGICRHIEYISNAQVAYDTATTFQVQGGIGYWRVVTDYADNDTFDQEIFIRRVKDPMSIYLDPDITEVDGADARYGFAFTDMPKDEFNEAYPKLKDKYAQTTLNDNTGWADENHVRIAEYYRAVVKSNRLVAFKMPHDGSTTVHRESDMKRILDKEVFKTVMDDPATKFRSIDDVEIEYFLIVGEDVAEENIWPGKYIPLVRVVGEETIIEGMMDRKGHTRALKDPQRIYNYWSSSAVEQVALQSKIPWVAPAQAIEGLETYWETANTVNHSILPYNHLDDAGNPIPAPQRPQAPVMASAYVQGMQIASDELRAVSGQYQAEMGAPSNERSGTAIQMRQRQGDNATYGFIDNLAIAIRYTGRILIDLIPKIYDTQRIIKIMAEDGVENEVLIDPHAKQAYAQKQVQINQQVKTIFNPNVGKYDVQADIGPAYATRRQETFNAFMQIISQAPEILKIAGDIMFKAADFPMANELAERMKRTMPPSLLGEGPSAEEQKMSAQLKQASQTVQKLGELLAEEKKKVESYRQGHNIDAYNAETNRLKVVGEDMKAHAMLLAQVLLDSAKTDPNASPEPPAAQPMPQALQGQAA